MQTPPHSGGYLNRIKPVSRQEAVASYSNENIQGLVKNAIARHLRSIFEEANSGADSSLLSQFGRGSTRYIVDKDFDPSSDQTKIKLPIRTFLEEIKNEIPCIVVSTTSCLFKTPGLGVNQGTARLSNGTLTHVFHIMRELQVVLMIVTTSQQDTEKLSQVVQMVYGDLVGFTTGHVLHGHEVHDRWSLHLPKVPEFSNPEKSPIGDSVTQMVWMSTVMLNTLFEDNLYITFDDNKYTIGIEEFGDPKIDFPETARVGRKVFGVISSLRDSQKIIVSDTNIAALVKGDIPSEYGLLCKKPGVVSIQVVDGVDNETPGSKNMFRPKIVVEHSVTISY